MRRAVVHVNLDPAGALGLGELERAVARLRADGREVIASDLDRLPAGAREIELLADGDDPEQLRHVAERACATALAAAGARAAPRATAVGFLSSGSREDAIGILRAFGVGAGVREVTFEDEDVAVLVLAAAALEATAVTRLQTALEAALNREVRFVRAEAA